MSKNYVIGFPRIGEQRELKRVLEEFWANKCSFKEVLKVSSTLKKRHWEYQKESGIDFISSNDFSLYDNMLDTSIMLGAIPKRFGHLRDEELYFAMARGNSTCSAMEMTKWFNTNYHYIVPELSIDDKYCLNAKKIIDEYNEAKALGIKTKINIIGPITYLALSKRVDGKDPYEFLSKIVQIYKELLQTIAKLDDELIVQIEEPIFVKDLDTKVLSLIKPTYDILANVSQNIKIALLSYFEHSNEATKILVHTPIWAIGLDFIYGQKNISSLELIANSNKKLIVGVVDGRNIWINNIQKSIDLLDYITKYIKKDNIIIGSSSSLLHTPYSVKYELSLNPLIKNSLSFALEKIAEITIISKLFFNKENLSLDEKSYLANNAIINDERKKSSLIHNSIVQERLKNFTKFQRDTTAKERLTLQRELFGYSDLVTTTIGSFPQTQELRSARENLKKSLISEDEYENIIKTYIDKCILIQEECGLDVLVHGEGERNDMVEYFAKLLDGFAFTQNGWVQSYGSRCVKPPLIYGDVSRPKPMTLKWITYAQSKTKKILKGMLSGPITILNWSFLRDDIPKSEISKQIALCIHDEIDDLQNSGVKIIQVDEAAFKEGYPLRKSDIKEYEQWATLGFKIATSSANKSTQIHTHMCYSEFNDIIQTIEDLDADVISIESARSGNELLKIFKKIGYTKEIGLGVYDIHSPRVPSVEEILKQIELLVEVLPKKQLWINPDCGLKTRKWEEVIPALKNMQEAVKIARTKNYL